MTYNAQIHIAPDQIIGPVHPHLYGTNLEHVGRSVYQGVWAEMLKCRKFTGHDRMYVGLSEGLSHQNPGFGITAPWTAVNPDYHRVLYVHDNTTFYTGQQAQRVTIRQSDNTPHGIGQSGLYLEAGRTYRLRLVLKGEGQTVSVQLGAAVRDVLAQPDWHTAELDFTPAATNPNASFCLTIVSGTVWFGCASLMPSNNTDGFRTDVIAALREWTPTFIRWPGGNFASAYRWQLGLGDIDKRSSTFDPAWQVWEPNDVGTDEFIALCKHVGSEPILTINMGTGSPKEAAAWVEYCNGETSTRWGKIRAANGHSEPYRVKTWFVGNEQFGNWQVGHCDAETYARRYLAYAAAMRAIDPDLRLIAVGVPQDLYGHWNELVLDIASPEIDALSVHYYSIRTELWTEPPPSETLYWPKVAAAHEMSGMLDRTINLVAEHSNPPVPVAFDEWNTYVAGKAPDFFEDYDIADALYVGALMNSCIQRADRIVMSAVFNLINVMGNYRVTATQIWKTPSSLVLELFTHHRGPLSVRCTVSCPTVSTAGAGNLPSFDAVPLVDAAATYHAESGSVFLSIVNRDPERSVIIDLTGISPSEPCLAAFVRGDSPQSLNTAEKPEAVIVENGQWDPRGSELTVPAHTVFMLQIPTGDIPAHKS